MWNRSFLLATLASCSLAAENSIQGSNGTTSTLVPSTNPGSGIETPITVTPVPETSNPATPPMPDTSIPQTATPGTPTPETPIIVTILPVTPITPVPVGGVNTSTITPTGFTLPYTVDKSVVTDLTGLPTLTTSRTTTSAGRTIAKTYGKSVISTAETLGGIDATSSAAKSVDTATTLEPIYTDLPAETAAHGRVPGDTSLPAPPESQAKTVDEGIALPVITPTTGAPEETAVKTVDEETALPVVTPTTVPEGDDPPEISSSPSGGNVVVLPDPDQPPSTTALATVVKTVEDGTALDPPTATAPGRTTAKSAGSETTLLVTQVPPNVDTGDTASSTEAKVVASQTGLGAPAPTNDVADAANTENAGGNVASYIACGLDNSCFQTTGAADGSQVVVVLPAPTQEPNSGAGESQPGSPNEGNDNSGQRVPANAPTEDFTYTAGAPTVVYDSNTLSVGGAAITISGAQVTLATGGLVVDGNTYTAPVAAPAPTSQALALLPAAAAYTYDAAESTFVYGSATLSAGGPAITVDGHTVSLAPSGGGVVFDSSTIAPSGESPAVVLSSDGSSAYAYTPGASTLVYGSTTLSVGGPAATIAGKSVTLGSDGVLVDGATITLEPVAAGPASATFDYTPGASTLVYGSTTLSVGGPAVTVDGKTISLASDAVLVDGAKITPQPVVVVAASATFDYTPGASTFVYGSTTLSIGGADTTIAGGQIVSLASSGVVVDGSVVAAATRAPSPAAVVTLGDEARSLTRGATLSVDGSAVLTLTPGAVVTSLPGDGESISVGRDGVVIDGKTVAFVSSSTRSATASATRSGLTTSRTTATGASASASDGTGSAAAASSTAAAGRGARVYSAGPLIAALGWIGAFVGV